MNCKMTGNIGGQTVRCDLREGHGGNHHAVVEATREMQIETERDELHEHAEELSEALAVEREAHGATRRLLGLARAEAAEWQRKVAEAEAALNGHLVGVEDRSPEEQDASMAPWRADPPHEPALDDLRAKHARQRETIRGAQAALPSDILDASETLGGAITAALAQKDAEIARLKAALDGTLVSPEPGEYDATLSEWHARRAPDVLERMRAAGAI